MTVMARAPRPEALVAWQPRRQVHVLIQTAPTFQVLATADDVALLDAERQAILDAPWDQDQDGERALSIHPALNLGRSQTYVAASTRTRPSFQRRNSFR